MSVVPPRQVSVLSIANYDELCAACGSSAADEAMQALRRHAIACGVDPDHMRKYNSNTWLIRLDELPRDEFLETIRRMVVGARKLNNSPQYEIEPVVRVGAMSERALRSFVNDAACDLLAYMNHVDCEAAFLAGDELDIWQKMDGTGIEFLSHEQLKYLDPFTGLLKPERFYALLNEIIVKSKSFDTNVSILYFDIDDFKSYNRTFDHNQGDALLLFVADQIAKAFPTDIVAHLSIDRFAVATDSTEIVRKCAAIHEATRTYRKSFAPEIKCGAFALEKGVGSANIALDCAKLACESTKGRYDISFRMFDDELKEQLFTRRYVARYAEQAVNERWIHAYAQPVVNTITGELCHFEALARWNDPERGILSPALFIPTLEDAHLIHKLDVCIVNEVCEHISKRRAQNLPTLPASVNLSRLDFGLCDVFHEVVAACDRWNVPHNMIAVEVTESALDSDSNLRVEMDRFRAAGFEVWMDDFGCGYSSLNLLKDYEFDVLKVDMEFLRDMESNKRSKTIVASVIRMAQTLGIKTLVEGVETKEQRDFLASIGCDMMQGYLFGKPQPLNDAWY